MTISFFDLNKEKKEKVGKRLPTQPETPQGKGMQKYALLSVSDKTGLVPSPVPCRGTWIQPPFDRWNCPFAERGCWR